VGHAAWARVWLNGSDQVGGSGPLRNKVFYFSEMNFQTTQKSLEKQEKYLGTPEKYEENSRYRLGYLAQLVC
jgi:hypothetical protein